MHVLISATKRFIALVLHVKPVGITNGGLVSFMICFVMSHTNLLLENLNKGNDGEIRWSIAPKSWTLNRFSLSIESPAWRCATKFEHFGRQLNWTFVWRSVTKSWYVSRERFSAPGHSYLGKARHMRVWLSDRDSLSCHRCRWFRAYRTAFEEFCIRARFMNSRIWRSNSRRAHWPNKSALLWAHHSNRLLWSSFLTLRTSSHIFLSNRGSVNSASSASWPRLRAVSVSPSRQRKSTSMKFSRKSSLHHRIFPDFWMAAAPSRGFRWATIAYWQRDTSRKRPGKWRASSYCMGMHEVSMTAYERTGEFETIMNTLGIHST